MTAHSLASRLVDAPLEVKPAGGDNEAGVDTDSVLQEKM